MNDLAVYDQNFALSRAGGNPELAAEIFKMLVSELPHHRNEIQQAVGASRLDDLRKTLHKLHGAASYTGVSALRNAVAQLESNLRRGETSGMEEHAVVVLDEIERVIDFARRTGSPQV